MEDSKLNRRSRPRPRTLPRPYDLRRKVLLKNFLREQMTYIPHIRLSSSEQNSDVNFSVEQPKSLELEQDLQELNDENSSSSVSGVDNSSSSENVEEHNSISDANNNSESNLLNDVKDSAVHVKATDVPAPEPKFFRLASMMNLRSESKKKKIKGILKAKLVSKSIKNPVKSKSFKTGLERLLSGRSRTSTDKLPDQTSKNSSKSLFSMFKSRRDQRKGRDIERTKLTTCTSAKSISKNEKNYTSHQSVQTDDSWARAELIKVEQSNRLLREENRLLSESLSYFMSSNSLDSHLNHPGSPLQLSNRNVKGLKKYPGSYDNLSTSVPYSYDNGNPRSRILRSKSVQEHSDRRKVFTYNYRTRSMNCHFNQADLHHETTSNASSFSSQPYIIPRVKRKDVLACSSVNGTGRVVQRRSSMPERMLSENDRSRICRRSGSVRDTRRTPFHSLPAEAFY